MLFSSCILTRKLDHRPYAETQAFAKTMQALDALQPIPVSDDELYAGWAKTHLIPAYSTPIAIDAARHGKKFEGIRDTVYARAIVFKKGPVKVAYVSVDLLIVPPLVAEILDTLLQPHGFNLNNIYLTATHTHSSIGAWHNSFVGKIFAGKYDPAIPEMIAHRMASAILSAERQALKATIGYESIPVSQLVYNRLVGEKGRLDSMVRIVKLVTEKEVAVVFSFTAHATIFHEKMMKISADWPGEAIRIIESSGKVNFACYAAGAVGSHGPYQYSSEQEVELQYMAKGVAAQVLQHLDAIPMHSVNALGMQRIPIYLREPQLRVNGSFALNPKWFYRWFGNPQLYLNKLQLGQLVWIGMPCDFSGELTYEVLPAAQSRNLELHINSFNGGFCGYITDDRWYDLKEYETRTMGWFGPGNGAYFSLIARSLLNK